MVTTHRLRVKDLHKAYWQGGQEINVLRGVDFEVDSGQSLAIVGASGVGKSTLLHCLGLLDTFDQGEIYFGDEKWVYENADRRAQKRREKIGFVFQFHYLMAELTALENVSLPLMIARQSMKETIQKSKVWLDRMGLSHRLNHRPAELSGGEQQRVSIARALVHEPQLILADEPTGNLDPHTAEEVFKTFVKQCHSLGSVLVMATHNHSLARFLDKTVRLEEGRIS